MDYLIFSIQSLWIFLSSCVFYPSPEDPLSPSMIKYGARYVSGSNNESHLAARDNTERTVW